VFLLEGYICDEKFVDLYGRVYEDAKNLWFSLEGTYEMKLLLVFVKGHVEGDVFVDFQLKVCW